MNKIHVTGHKGLVGSAIASEIECLFYPEKIHNKKTFEEFVLDNKVNTVIHAAGRVGGLQTNFEKHAFVGYGDENDDFAFVMIPGFRPENVPNYKLIKSDKGDIFISIKHNCLTIFWT